MAGRRRGEKRRGRYWIRDHNKEEERRRDEERKKRRGIMERVGRETAPERKKQTERDGGKK